MRRHSIEDPSEIDTIKATGRNMATSNPEGGVPTILGAIPEKFHNMANKIISNIEIRHQKELARKDKE